MKIILITILSINLVSCVSKYYVHIEGHDKMEVSFCYIDEGGINFTTLDREFVRLTTSVKASCTEKYQ